MVTTTSTLSRPQARRVLTQEMEDILGNTYASLIFRTDIQLAQKLGGYSMGEADLMRPRWQRSARDSAHRRSSSRAASRKILIRGEGYFPLMAQFADYAPASHSVATRTSRISRVPEGELRGALLRGGDDLHGRRLGQDFQVRLGAARAEDQDAAAGRERVGAGLHAGRGGHPLRALGHQGHRPDGGRRDDRGARRAALHFALRLRREGRREGRGQEDAREPRVGGRVRLAQARGGDAARLARLPVATVDRALDGGSRQRRSRASGQGHVRRGRAGEGGAEGISTRSRRPRRGRTKSCSTTRRLPSASTSRDTP